MKYQHYILGILCLAFLVSCGDDGFQSIHFQGRDCMPCHSSGEKSFTSGLTVYTKINGRNESIANVARDARIQLLLDNGKTINYGKGNGYGNFKFTANQGAINNFTARILDASGKVVNQSAKNSHNVGRLACNSCHTQSGLSGAPGRIVNFDYSGSLAQSLVKK